MRSNLIAEFVCLISLASFVACKPSQPVNAAANEPEQLTLDVPAPEPAPLEVTVIKAAPKPAAAREAKPTAAAAPKSMAAQTTASSTASAPVAMETPGRESYAAKTAQAHDDESVAATITGCLVHDDDMFQLKDTDGEQAPKARSWKSGFIRRSSAKVHVLASDGLSLKSHVGHRVSVSGMLTDRELHARSVRATSERCD